jgi:hypothetical protein
MSYFSFPFLVRFSRRFPALGTGQMPAVAFSSTVLAICFLAGSCASRAPLAVPEKQLVQRVNLGSPDWLEWAMCAVQYRAHCENLHVPKTTRSDQELNDFRKFFGLLTDPSCRKDAADPNCRKYVDFRRKVKDLNFVEEKDWVVDAEEERADSPPGRIAYKIHDCWIVLYSTNENGLYTKDSERAIIRYLSVFCARETS